MSFDLRSLEIQVITKSFYDQIQQKQFTLSQIQQNFVSRCSLSKDDKNHQQFIKYTRKMIQTFQKIHKDLYSFFLDLRIGSLYTLFEKMFKLMILGYKTLSQLLLSIQKKKSMSIKKYFNDDQKCTRYNFNQTFGIQMNNTEKIDYILNGIQYQETRLEIQKDYLEKNLQFHKKAIQNIHASDARNQIKQFKKIFQNILSFQQDLVSQDYIFKHQQTHNLILKLKKPSSIKQEILKDLSTNLKQTFIGKITQFITTISNYFQIKSKQIAKKQFQDNKLSIVSQQSQTLITLNDIIKIQKIQSTTEDQLFQQQIKSKREIIKENYHLKKRIKQVENQLVEVEKKQIILEQILKKKNFQIDNIKNDWDWKLQKKNDLIEKLNQKISQIRNEKAYQFSNIGVNCDRLRTFEKDIQVEIEQKPLFHKTAGKRKDKKQLNSTSKKKVQEKTEIISCVNRILQDLQINLRVDNILEEGLSDITKQIRQQISKLKDKKIKLEKVIRIYDEEKINKLKKQKIACTQTTEQTDQICIQQEEKTRNDQEKQRIITNGRLERLKKQLMEKVLLHKRNKQSNRNSENKQVEKVKKLNKIIENENPLFSGSQIIKKQNINKLLLSKKQISFEEIKIQRKSFKNYDLNTRFHPKGNIINRKKQKKTAETRNSNIISTEITHNQSEKQFHNILTIENSSKLIQLNRLLIDLFNNKQNKKQYKNMIVYLLNQIKKQLGKTFIIEQFSEYLKRIKQQED